MAFFVDGNAVSQITYTEPFEVEYKPGDIGLLSGIYHCTGCGDEIAHNGGNTLPPQNRHQHASVRPIRWKLLVMSISK